ncbi:unnamed protein product [Cunninghamella blakesleeana]
MGVLVNDQVYPLTSSIDTPILYTGKGPFGDYRYVKVAKNNGHMIEQEPFLRSSQLQVPNEFYNRTWNTKQIQPLPHILDTLPSVQRLNSDLHKENSIPTIFIKGNQQQINTMHTETAKDIAVTVDFTFIENNQIKTFKNVELKLAGRSSRWTSKLSYSIGLPKDQSLYGYRKLKLRALSYDPAYIREKLTTDVMKSTGLPSTGSSYTRLIMNDQPIGLYLMIENYKNPWFMNEFANGETFNQGITYQAGASISDLSYFGTINITQYEQAYKIEEDPTNKNDKSYNKLIAFTKFLDNAPLEDAEIIWNQQIDMESVIRSLALEIVAGFSDGYIGNANNFHLYDNLQEERFTFIKSDYDNTFGNTLIDLSLMWQGDYTKYPGFNIRPLTKKMMTIPTFKERFESLLQLYLEQLIHPKVLFPRIDDLTDMIREDVEWDQQLPRVSNRTWTDAIGTEFETDDPPYPLHAITIQDFKTRSSIPLDKAIDGPTNHISLPGVKEWITVINENMQSYFDQYPSSTKLN